MYIYVDMTFDRDYAYIKLDKKHAKLSVCFVVVRVYVAYLVKISAHFRR